MILQRCIHWSYKHHWLYLDMQTNMNIAQTEGNQLVQPEDARFIINVVMKRHTCT